jgi:hypothetical protein
MTQQSAFVSYWQYAAADLALDVIAPFTVSLANASFEIPVLLRNFGGRLGMLLTTDYEQLKPFAATLVDAGYGYSVLSEPAVGEAYSREGIIEVLADWGWSGPAHERPGWLVNPPAADA